MFMHVIWGIHYIARMGKFSFFQHETYFTKTQSERSPSSISDKVTLRKPRGTGSTLPNSWELIKIMRPSGSEQMTRRIQSQKKKILEFSLHVCGISPIMHNMTWAENTNERKAGNDSITNFMNLDGKLFCVESYKGTIECFHHSSLLG